MTSLNNCFRAAAVALAIAAPGVYAQWVVFDPENFAKNALTAVQSAAAAARLLDQYRLQAQQYITQIQNLKQVDPALVNSAVGRDIAAAAGYSDDPAVLAQAGIQTRNVYQSAAALLGQGTRLYQQSYDFGLDMTRMSIASGMSPEQIFSYERSHAQAQQRVGKLRYQQAEELSRQLNYFQARADDQLKAAQGSEGAVQSLSAVAAGNHLLSDQLSSILLLQSNREKAEGVKAMQEGQDKEAAERAAEDARRRNQSVIDYFSSRPTTK